MLLLQILFWLSILAVLHSYLFYPIIVKLLSSGRRNNTLTFQSTDELPGVSIIVPAYNEEAVIAEKIESVLKSDYPGKIEILVGSDASTDRTNAIVKELSAKHSNIRLVEFGGRSGKAAIANRLVKEATHSIIILTDANILFHEQTVLHLLKHFKDPSIGLVDSHMKHLGMRKEGISLQESSYIESEVRIKHAEGLLWGSMMGPFGGCFAFRKELYSPVPENSLVDDFYINMKVLEKKAKAINELEAIVYEDVSNELSEEFRRKVRIATGNFQNLFTFLPLLFRFNGISFSFLSHKVLRWLGPFFMITSFISSFVLALHFLETPSTHFIIYAGLFSLMCYAAVIPLIDLALKNLQLNFFLLRLITHFFTMNLALFIGFFRFLGGVRSGTWTPTRRNQ